MAELEQDHVAEDSLAQEYVQSLTDAGMNIVQSVAYHGSLESQVEALHLQGTELDENRNQLQRSTEIFEVVKAKAKQQLSLICIDRVKNALESEDYESAAKFVLKFLQIDAQYDDSDSKQREELLELKKQLQDIVKKKLLAAIDQENCPTILKFLRLFTPLGMETEGLELYVSYLKKVIAKRAVNGYEVMVSRMEQGFEDVDFVECFTNFFKDIINNIDTNDANFRALDGEDGIVYALRELQAECDLTGWMLWGKYKDYRKLTTLVADNTPNQNLLADPEVVESCIMEIMLLMHRSKDFTDSMVSRIRSVHPESLRREETRVYRREIFSSEVQDVTGLYVILEKFYITLEVFYMTENVRHAIRIDDHLPETHITSMVADVFDMLNRCLTRAIDTSNIRCVIDVMSHACSFLGNDYHEALQHKSRREPHIDARLFLANMVAQNTEHGIVAALDEIDLSCEYTLKLMNDIDKLSTKEFAATPADDRKRIKSYLSKLSELGNTFKQSGMKQLVADRERIKTCLSGLGELINPFSQACMEQLVAIVTQRIRPVLDTVATISYELIETEHTETEECILDNIGITIFKLIESEHAKFEGCSPWVDQLLYSVKTNAASLQSITTSGNYNSFLDLIIEFILNRLEFLMMQKCFSNRGALQLVRDIKALVVHFTRLTQRYSDMRDKFARLNQMAGLLKSERYLLVPEILEYCAWNYETEIEPFTLTPGEILSVLSLRVEFKPEPATAH